MDTYPPTVFNHLDRKWEHLLAGRQLDRALARWRDAEEPLDEFRRIRDLLGLLEDQAADPERQSEVLLALLRLALHRHGADADTLLEALWPGQPPRPARLYTEASRARKALGYAIWAVERGLLADPLAEALVRDLMEAAAATGNTAHAHAAMTRLRRQMSEDADTNDANDWLHPDTLATFEQLCSAADDPTARNAPMSQPSSTLEAVDGVEPDLTVEAASSRSMTAKRCWRVGSRGFATETARDGNC